MRHGPVTEFLPLSPGWFAVLFPGEPHAPLIGEGLLTKIVIKVLVE
jgi:beta-galactosidase beta subunit